MGGGTLGAVVTWALMVSAADTNPGVMARQGAMTNALINPALRTLREKLIDMTPPLIFDCSDGFFYHLLASTWYLPNDFSPSGHSDSPPV